VLLVATGAPQYMLAKFRWVAAWAQGTSPLQYHWILLEWYPLIYGLFPLIVALAITRSPRPAIFSATTFCVALAIHSAAGMRSGRYIYYITPFFFIAAGFAAAALAPRIFALAEEAWSRVDSRSNGVGNRWVGRGLIACSVTLALACSPGIYKAIKIVLLGPGSMHPQYTVDWTLAQPTLIGAASRTELIVSTNALSALYYLGRHDIEFSGTVLAETEKAADFSIDARTGRLVASSTSAMLTLMSCHRSGLVVTERWQWGSELYGLNQEITQLLLERAKRLPAESGVIAFEWHSAEPILHHDCPRIPGRLHATTSSPTASSQLDE
jgi:hypothetical protein